MTTKRKLHPGVRPDRDPLINAACIIYDHARQDPRLQAAIDATFTELDALRIPDTWTVEQMRAVGGWTKLVLDTFAKHIGDATAPGSKIFGDVPLRTLFGKTEAGELRNSLIARAETRKWRV